MHFLAGLAQGEVRALFALLEWKALSGGWARLVCAGTPFSIPYSTTCVRRVRGVPTSQGA